MEESDTNEEQNAGSNTSNDLQMTEQRPSCPFGVKCYRKNPAHLSEMAHLMDADFKLPPLPQSLPNALECKYGANCYRLNPTHYANFKHPADINVLENYKCYHLKRRRRRRTQRYGSPDAAGSELTDDEDEDPFATDSDDTDYMPSDES